MINYNEWWIMINYNEWWIFAKQFMLIVANIYRICRLQIWQWTDAFDFNLKCSTKFHNAYQTNLWICYVLNLCFSFRNEWKKTFMHICFWFIPLHAAIILFFSNRSYEYWIWLPVLSSILINYWWHHHKWD